MFTGMEPLLAGERRQMLTREVGLARLGRRLRANARVGGRRVFWPSRETEDLAAAPSPHQKIRNLHDAGVPARA